MGCSANQQDDSISKTGTYFDTVITIQLYDSDAQEELDHCFEICERYENMLSRTIEGSEVYQINHANGETTSVSNDTARLIQTGLHYSELSDGAFDITIAPLSILWDFKNNTGTIPSQEDIEEALSHVGYENIELNGNNVTLKDPKAAIDLGALAKGYIADRIKRYLVSKGIESGIINLGGNVLTIGSKPDGEAFNIGIQKPFDERNSTITSVKVTDQSVVSSGNYERYFEKDGKIYHHILDTSTGYPVDNNLYEVTILSDGSITGDCLSTTCYALGLEKGMELINSIDDVEAIFITSDYEIYDTRDQ
jgi:thiamine biosynthesis lipoprotein